MSTSRAVARGTSRLLAGVLVAKTLDFAFYLVIARQLGVEEFGRYVYALSFTLLFSIVADLGVSTVVTREAARAPHRTRHLLRHALIAKSALAAVTLALTVGVSLLTHASAQTLALVALFTVAMLLNSSAMLFEALLKAAGHAGQSGLTVAAQSAAALLAGLALLHAGAGAVGGGAAYLVGGAIHLAAAMFWSRDLWRSAPAPAGGDAEAQQHSDAASPAWPELLRESAPLALSGVFIAVYFRIDSVLLRLFQGEAAVGLYGAAYRFFEAFVLISAAYRSVLFPIMARAADGPAAGLSVLCRKSMRLHLMFTVGVAAFFSVEARDVIVIVLGEPYAAAAPALALLVWALPGAFMADTLYHLLAAQRRQRVSARIVGVTAVFNLLLNLALIPRLSIVGAAVTTIASEVLTFALLFLAFRPSVPRVGLATVARGPLLAGAVTIAALLLAGRMNPGGVSGVVLMGLVATIAYGTSLVALGALGRGDAELVAEMLPSAIRDGVARARGQRASDR